MSNPDLVAKKLAFIETCVRQLREVSRPEHIATNVREDRFVAHSLQIAIQEALDVASHIVSNQRLGNPAPAGTSWSCSQTRGGATERTC